MWSAVCKPHWCIWCCKGLGSMKTINLSAKMQWSGWLILVAGIAFEFLKVFGLPETPLKYFNACIHVVTEIIYYYGTAV